MKTETETDALPETKRRLLDAGVNLMRRQGYAATTVDDVCAAAKVTKGAFFHYFDNKEEIAEAALDRFLDGKIQELAAAPFRTLADPLDRVYGRIDFIKETFSAPGATPRGCLIGMFAHEISVTHPALREACQRAIARMTEGIETDLAQAKALHAPHATFDPKAVALFYVAVSQGSTLIAKVCGSQDVLLDNLDQFRQYIQLLFGKTAKRVR